MGFFNKFKNSDVPQELPDLALDKIKEDASSKPQSEPVISPKVSQPLPKLQGPPLKSSISNIKKLEKIQDDKGFFKETIKEITGEIQNLDKIDHLYKSTFMSGDIVNQMRDYWERQKPEVLLNAMGSELKVKLLEKTDKLHLLEKDWQEIYFNLLSKEEEIRNEEKELKEHLTKFVTLFKNSTKKENKS